MDVRLKFAKERFLVGFIENDHVVHGGKSGDQHGAGTLGENRPAFAFQFPCASIGMNGHDKQIAFLASRAQIADVPGVKHVENAVREDDFPSGAAVFFEHFVQTGTGKSLFARIHSDFDAARQVHNAVRKSITLWRWRQIHQLRKKKDFLYASREQAAQGI